ARRRPNPNLHALTGEALDAADLGGSDDLDAFVSEELFNLLGCVRVMAFQELRAMLNDRYPAAEAAIGLGEFKADVTAADNNQMFRQPVEFEELDVRQRSALGQAGNRWDRRMSTDI